jgi:hypothetical protein
MMMVMSMQGGKKFVWERKGGVDEAAAAAAAAGAVGF